MVCSGPNRILDLGCGSGAVGRKLLEVGKAASVVGAELFPDAAAIAAEHYEQVHTGDIESMELPYGPEFDYVICGDILEHLKDPYSVVNRIYQFIKPGGSFICSVPNVRYWKVLADLAFRGRWQYTDAGIMDRTHLRFFTRRSCFQMIQDGGFVVERWGVFLGGRRYRMLNAITLGVFREFLGTQIQVLSTKPSSLKASLS
jgi:2-polyprenyl-3-methyl-5-hydroxy-6-metoxy-1,4-benzoquinol methylase